jgi:hypothetical protein
MLQQFVSGQQGGGGGGGGLFGWTLLPCRR